MARGQSAHVTAARVALLSEQTQPRSYQTLSDNQARCGAGTLYLAMNASERCRVTNQWKQLGHDLFMFSFLLGHPQQYSPRVFHREERTDLHLKHSCYRTPGAAVAAHDFTANPPYPESETSAPKGPAALRAPRQHVHAPGAGTAKAAGPIAKPGVPVTAGRAGTGRFSLRRCSERPGGAAPTPGRNGITALSAGPPSPAPAPGRRSPRPIPAPPPREPKAAPPLPAALRLSVPPRRAEVRGAGEGPASCRPRRGSGGGRGSYSEPPLGSRPPRSGPPRRAALPCRAPLRPGPLVDVPVPSRPARAARCCSYAHGARTRFAARLRSAVPGLGQLAVRRCPLGFHLAALGRTGGPCARRRLPLGTERAA